MPPAATAHTPTSESPWQRATRPIRAVANAAAPKSQNDRRRADGSGAGGSGGSSGGGGGNGGSSGSGGGDGAGASLDLLGLDPIRIDVTGLDKALSAVAMSGPSEEENDPNRTREMLLGQQLALEQRQFERLKQDFTYNLSLLRERDAELERYDMETAAMRAELEQRTADAKRAKAEADDRDKLLADEAKHVASLQQRLRESEVAATSEPRPAACVPRLFAPAAETACWNALQRRPGSESKGTSSLDAWPTTRASPRTSIPRASSVQKRSVLRPRPRPTSRRRRRRWPH